MTTIKVVQVLAGLDLGGTESHVVALARRLDRSRFDVHIACLRPGGVLRPDVERLFQTATYPIARLFGPRTLRQQLRFARDLRTRRIDVVHAYGFYPNVFAIPAARLAGVPARLAAIRDNGDLWSRSQRVAERCVCRLATGVAVNARAVRDRLARDGYPPARIAVVRNGVDLGRFAPGGEPARRDPEERARRRVALGVPSGAPLVAVVSRLNPLKGIDDFLRAAARLSQRNPAARFLVVGDGPCRSDLERLAQSLRLDGRVTFTGARPDVAALLAAADVSVVPSLSEALCNVLLESMAAGTPLVATRVGGTPEVVEDGTSGLLVPACDPPALAHAVLRVLEDPVLAAALSDGGLRRVRQHFSIERMVRETEDLYEALAAGRPMPRVETGDHGIADPAGAPSRAFLEARRRATWGLIRDARRRRTA